MLEVSKELLGWETGIESDPECKYNNLERSRGQSFPAV